MPPISDMTVKAAEGELPVDFRRKVDQDKDLKKCIWCEAGRTNNKKKNHPLIDCPTAYPAFNDRTPLSREIFYAGREDAAVAYIHHKQRLEYPRADNATTFSAGLPRSQMATYTVPVPTTPAPVAPVAPSAPSHNPITPVPSPQPTASSTTQGVPPGVPSPSVDQVSSGFLNLSIVPTAGSTPTTVAQTQSIAFTQNPVPSAITTVNLQDTPAINFNEVARSRAAPAATVSQDGTLVNVDSGLAEKLTTLNGTTKYPLRTSLRERPKGDTVITNYFQMTVNTKATFYEYRIIGIPSSESRAGKKRYMETAIQNVPFLSQNTNSFATDNVNTIISWKNLHEHATSVQIVPNNPVTGIGGEWRLVNIDDRNTTAHLNFHYSRQIDIAGLRSYANTMNTDPTTYDPTPAENALNIIMSKCITNNNTLNLNNHKFYVRNAFRDLMTPGEHAIAPLRALRGYSYRVHPAMGNILLNVSPANSAFWRPLLVSQVLFNGRGPFGGGREDVKRALKNVRIYVVYDRDSKDKKCKHPSCNDPNCRANDRADMVSMDVQHARLKTIRGFGTACNNQTFPWEHKDAQGNAIAGHIVNRTIEQYQFIQYGRTLQHPELPPVNVGTTLKPTWFAPEDLRIVPDQIYAKIIPDLVATDFHRGACRPPAEIRSRIEQEGLRHIPVNAANNTLLGCPQIKVTPIMLQIPSVRLPYPSILYGNSATTVAAGETGRWNLQNFTFLQRNADNLSWKLIRGPGVNDGSATLLTANFNSQLRQTGVTLNAQNQGAPLVLYNSTERHLENTIRNYLVHMKEQKLLVPDIFVLLMRNKDQKLYSSFKYLTDKVFVLQSICMTVSSMRGGNITQYMANVAMKANLKMAGINHSAPGIETWLNKTLVLGADCTHPGSGALKGSPSVAAVVGSLDANGGRFRGKLKLQPGKQEIIDGLENFLLDHFTAWYTYHGDKFPENVLYYRDGVSISQYDDIIDTELAGIEKAFENLVKAQGGEDVQKLKITAVIVNKRHNTRFFPRKKGDEMSNGNCKPGLLVDSAITSPYYTDFYLQSHNGIKGTARSAHYTVIRNDMVMTTTELEDLTHKLNHTYVRATLGVSYAAPAYYADRLCERARCYLREWYNPDSDKRQAHHDQLVSTERMVEQNRNNTNANMPARTRGHKKTDAEIQAEKDDVEDVDDRMHAWLKPEYEARWDAQPDAVVLNPEARKKGFEQTMYWM
ncbi:hypothetical protein G6011_04188 [Alternaria panax]|uniref:Piwi domain-containing protein n=1 Tax=Alternaria panax TaxID=48097 RepID=A0AAD4NTS2_9PLEO|nr:hypothetical protein G6011_04188 [Alternaria panax]